MSNPNRKLRRRNAKATIVQEAAAHVMQARRAAGEAADQSVALIRQVVALYFGRPLPEELLKDVGAALSEAQPKTLEEAGDVLSDTVYAFRQEELAVSAPQHDSVGRAGVK